MPPLEDRLTSRDRSDHPKPGKRRALGKGPWPRRGAVGGSKRLRRLARAAAARTPVLIEVRGHYQAGGRGEGGHRPLGLAGASG